MTIEEVKEVLKKFKIRPSKKLGQNFLLSEEVLDEIVATAELKKSDTVLEVGPGLGFLTERLAERSKLVLSLEKDFALTEGLRKKFKNKKPVKIIRGDALFIKPEELGLEEGSFKVVANLPYYITGKFLRNILTSPVKPELMVLLLQKEVVERVVATPGSHTLLSLSVQMYGQPELIETVSRDEFYPRPKVNSAILKIRLEGTPRIRVNEKKFFQFLRIGFSSPRKILSNNLSAGLSLDKTEITSVLQKIGLSERARPGDLSLGEWEKLYVSLFDKK